MKHREEDAGWAIDTGSRTTRRSARQELRVAMKVHGYRSSSDRSTILLAEDDSDMRGLLAASLRTSGYHVIEVNNGRELFEAITTGRMGQLRFQPDLIVSDIRMPGSTGLEVLRVLRGSDWAMPVVLITAFGDPQTHEEARRLGAALVLDKPFDLQVFERSVRNIVPPAV